MKDAVWLVICGAGPDSGIWPIEEGRHVIGRSKECTIHVRHPSVSRRHAEVVKKDGKLTIRDLGSRNGTIIDGKEVRHAEIAIGTTVQLGEVTLELLDRRPSRFQATCDDEETDPNREEVKATDLRIGGPFSPQRVRVLRLLVRGFSEKEIAPQVGTTEYAVHWHVKGLYEYYGIHSRAQLVAQFRPTARTI